MNIERRSRCLEVESLIVRWFPLSVLYFLWAQHVYILSAKTTQSGSKKAKINRSRYRPGAPLIVSLVTDIIRKVSVPKLLRKKNGSGFKEAKISGYRADDYLTVSIVTDIVRKVSVPTLPR